MTEVGGAIDAEELQERLPDGWRVENNNEGVYGFADACVQAARSDPLDVPACFSIQPDSGLWTATWKVPHQLGDDLCEVSSRVTGVRERCVEWVLERANRPEGCRGE